jgi:predicted dehydrogenase
MDEVGIGLFGYGFIASAHVEALRTVGARIVAVCGPHRERAETFARRCAIAHVYTEPARMLARADIAAVVVASPDASHAALTMAAAQAGKHVFCEKPLATTLAEARAMVAAVQENGRVGMTGFLLRGAPVVQRMAATIRQGDAGTLISLHAQRSNATLLGPEAVHTWRTDARQSGLGVLGDLGSHMIDLALLLAGPITDVSADLRTFVQELPDAATGRPVPQRLDDDVTLALRFAGGAHGTMSLSRVGVADAHLPLGRSQIVVNGSKLAIISDGIAHATVHRLGSAPQEWPLDARVARLDHGALLAYLGKELMRAFLEAIRSGVPAPPTLEDGLAVQAVLDAALRSATSRCWEPVPGR